MIAEHFPHEAKDIPYESLFQAANDIMLLADADNTIVEANECAVNTYGWPRHELLGRPIDSLRSPRGRFDFPVDMENLRLRGKQFFETEHQTADGRRFPVEVSASLIDNTRGGGGTCSKSCATSVSARHLRRKSMNWPISIR